MARLEPLDELSAADRLAIIEPLGEDGRAKGFVWSAQTVAIALRDDDGRVIGGLIGEIVWEWLRIEILAVAHSHQGQGWGRRLMERAEAIARERGCHSAWVDTFSFQARPFYETLGYRVFGRLDDFPTGQTRYFLSKRLPA